MSTHIQTEELNLVRVVLEDSRFGNTNGNDATPNEPILVPVPGTRTLRLQELYVVGGLALPTMIIQMGTVFPGFLTASYIGRNFPVEYLDGFTLASLTINLFTLSLLQGLYTASDTLSPQAYGAGNAAELGHLAVRGILGTFLVAIPTFWALAYMMKPGLIYLGIDAEASTHAYHWYLVNGISLPFFALFQVTWKFLSAQHVMAPLVICTLLACGIVLPITLWTMGAWFGFLGTAGASVVFQFVLALALLLYLSVYQPHDSATWPGLSVSLKQAMHWKSFRTYMQLGLGGMLASSEWIYWEALSLMIGSLGVVPLSVHTVPTQVVTVMFMLPLSLGTALSIRLGSTLPVSVTLAKQVVCDCLILGAVFFGLLSIALYTQRRHIFLLFTTSDLVVAGCEEIWWKVCVYTFCLCMFGILMGISVGLGLQWKLGITAIVFLWMFALPTAYYLALVHGGGLNAAWSTIWPPYVGINLTLAAGIIRADWDEIAEGIRIREGVELTKQQHSPGNQPLLSATYGSVE